MPKIQWCDEYSVGNQQVDDQHKKWIEIYNTAHEKMMSADEKVFGSSGVDALQDVIDYTRYHFNSEEKLMEALGFDELAYHKNLHINFVAQIEKTMEEIKSGTLVLNSEIIKTIKNWLIHHILNEDQKIRPFNQK